MRMPTTEPMPFEEAKTLVESTTWYHGWEILPGLHTGGKSLADPKRALDRYGVPANLKGVRALDIGAWDGPYSFELERRGAEVLSYDIQDPNSTAYNAAKKILGSSCEYSRGSVYDLDAAKHGRFDLVLFLGVFYHLKHPMVAWNRIREVMNPGGILFFEGAILDWAWNVDQPLNNFRNEIEAVRKLPVTYFAAGKYASCWSNWHIPTSACLHDWLIAAGFKDISMGFKEESSRAYGKARLNPSANLEEHGISQANAAPLKHHDTSITPKV